MDTNQPLTRMDRLALAMSTASNKRVGLVAGIYFGLIISIIGLLTIHYSKKSSQQILFNAAGICSIAIVAGLLFGLLMSRQIAAQKHRRNEMVGLALSNEDIRQLTMWYRRGIMPKSERLQPILNKYLDYMESIVTGQQLYKQRPWRSLILIIIFGLQVPINLYLLATDHKDTFRHVYNLLIALSILILYISARRGSRGSLYARLSRRQVNKISKLRATLNQTFTKL